MICKYCGTSVPDGSEYCTECGKKLNKERLSRHILAEIKQIKYWKPICIGFSILVIIAIVMAAIASGSNENVTNNDDSAKNTYSYDNNYGSQNMASETYDYDDSYDEEDDFLEDDYNSDLELIMREGHPVYLDSINEAKDCWSDVDFHKITYEVGYYESDETILTFSSLSNNREIIDAVEFYFMNVSDLEGVSFDEAENVVMDYMPDQSYGFKLEESYMVTPTDPDPNSILHYGQYYVGRFKNAQGQEMNIKFHQTDDGLIETAEIRDRLANEFKYPEDHEFTKKQWTWNTK